MLARSLGCALSAVLAAASLAGCATTAASSVTPFAAAGTQYTQAVETLLATSTDLLVDANSRKLLQGLSLAPGTAEMLEEQDEAMRANLTEVRLLRRQLDLLGEYFQSLSALATSDVPKAFGDELARTAAALDGVSTSLRQTPLFRNAAAGEALVGEVGGLIVEGVRGHELRRELERRKATITEVLSIQERLLDALRAQVLSDVEIDRQRDYDTEVVAPFETEGALSSDPQRQAWVDARRKLLTDPILVQELDAAAASARALRAAWAKVLANRLTPADVEAVVAQLSPIVANVAALRAASSPPAAPDNPGGN